MSTSNVSTEGSYMLGRDYYASARYLSHESFHISFGLLTQSIILQTCYATPLDPCPIRLPTSPIHRDANRGKGWRAIAHCGCWNRHRVHRPSSRLALAGCSHFSDIFLLASGSANLPASYQMLVLMASTYQMSSIRLRSGTGPT